ncbi:hypothetical protein HYT17_00610 [Candidatus Microgenomates bacterium]|nr:hypothetical protein [Candidatus Microgenomates bacterium]
MNEEGRIQPDAGVSLGSARPDQPWLLNTAEVQLAAKWVNLESRGAREVFSMEDVVGLIECLRKVKIPDSGGDEQEANRPLDFENRGDLEAAKKILEEQRDVFKARDRKKIFDGPERLLAKNRRSICVKMIALLDNRLKDVS